MSVKKTSMKNMEKLIPKLNQSLIRNCKREGDRYIITIEGKKIPMGIKAAKAYILEMYGVSQ